MYHFEYVEKEEWKPVREEIENILNQVQDSVRHDFTFSYRFIGSSKYHMITYDPKTNIGYDFDVNLYINDDENKYTAKEQKHIIMNALNQIVWRYGYGFCIDSTRVITVKKISASLDLITKIHHSFDIAIVHDYVNERGEEKQEYIRLNKKNQTYAWVDQSKGYNLDKKITWLKKNSLWQEVRETYLKKKNRNNDPDKKSRSLFAETINELYVQNF